MKEKKKVVVNQGHKLWEVEICRYEFLKEVDVWVTLYSCTRNILTGRIEKRSYQGIFRKEFHGTKREEKAKKFLKERIGEEIL